MFGFQFDFDLAAKLKKHSKKEAHYTNNLGMLEYIGNSSTNNAATVSIEETLCAMVNDLPNDCVTSSGTQSATSNFGSCLTTINQQKLVDTAQLEPTVVPAGAKIVVEGENIFIVHPDSSATVSIEETLRATVNGLLNECATSTCNQPAISNFRHTVIKKKQQNRIDTTQLKPTVVSAGAKIVVEGENIFIVHPDSSTTVPIDKTLCPTVNALLNDCATSTFAISNFGSCAPVIKNKQQNLVDSAQLKPTVVPAGAKIIVKGDKVFIVHPDVSATVPHNPHVPHSFSATPRQIITKPRPTVVRAGSRIVVDGDRIFVEYPSIE